MFDWFFPLQIWHWLILSIILIIFEIMLPTTLLLWMAIAAGAVGFIVLLAPPISWEIQFLIFSVVSLVSVSIGRMYVNKSHKNDRASVLNKRGNQYINRIFTLEEDIINGSGKLNVDDTIWRIEGPDCPTGTRIEVIATNGVIMIVEIIQTIKQNN